MIGCLQRNENTGWTQIWAMGLASQSIGTEVSVSTGNSLKASRKALIAQRLGFPKRPQVDPKLLAFFVEVTAFESQRLCGVGHVVMIAL
jgi:hypothetical protein